jgi:tripeptidyl-peptidase-1
MDISDPTSEKFGKHWTPEQVHEFFSPSEDTVQEVREWLSSYGIDKHRHKVAPSRGHVQFHASVDEVEALLGTQYDIWENTGTGKMSISCDEYHVSPEIQKHIDFVTPTIGLDPSASHSLARRTQKRGVGSNRSLAHGSERGPVMKKPAVAGQTSCWELASPQCIKDLYQIADPSENTTQPGNELGLYEEMMPYDQLNLDWFFSQFAPHIPNGTHPAALSIDGGVNVGTAGQGGPETMLDLNMVYPIIYPQGVKIFQTYSEYLGENGYTGIFNQFLDALDASYCTYEGGDDPKIDPKFPDGTTYNKTRICGAFKPTNVISVSYIVAEDAYTPAYATRQCHEYMKLGLMGTSIIVASGDNGTLSRFPDQGCLANGAQRPGFPTSCPYGKQ